jgi:hypothetical protein
MNKELYTAAMDDLPISADFSERVINNVKVSRFKKGSISHAFVVAVILFAVIAVSLCFVPKIISSKSGALSSGPNFFSGSGGNDFGPGVKYLSSCEEALYFQPYFGRAKTSSVFCWDSKTLTETPAKNIDGLFAYSQGCYYSTNNVLYRYEKSTNQAAKIRDLNNDRRLGDVSTRKDFTVRLFYADQSGIYAACYGSGNNANGRGESPFFLLRISPDGVKAFMIYADGKGETGTYLSSIQVLDNRIYYSHSGGIYSLDMNGGDKRLLTTSRPHVLYGYCIPPTFYKYSSGFVFWGQPQSDKDNPMENLFTIKQDGTEEKRITSVKGFQYLTVQNNKVYYAVDPADHSIMYSGIHAYNLTTGKDEYVMDNKQQNESYTGDYFYQALPANHGIFMVHMGGEVCYYNTETKKLITIYGG